MQLTNLFWDGIADDRKEHVSKEAGKVGTLRAGDSGVMSKGGDVVGGCHRRSYVRSFLGLETELPQRDNLLMFELGKANESIWMDKLRRTWPGTIKQEEEIPIKWSTSKMPVSGRPDIVLCDANGQPKLGIEHKAICSLWTARDVSFELTPKTKHLIQAAHYGWQLAVPYRLVYTQYTNFALPDWAHKMFPAGHPLVELSDKGKPKHIKPHITVYEVGFGKGDVIQYRLEGESRWTVTPWSTTDIQRYYEFVSSMEEKKVLGSRPTAMKSDGSQAGYSDCAYCPLQEICDKYENKWEEWNEQVKKICAD